MAKDSFLPFISQAAWNQLKIKKNHFWLIRLWNFPTIYNITQFPRRIMRNWCEFLWYVWRCFLFGSKIFDSFLWISETRTFLSKVKTITWTISSSLYFSVRWFKGGFNWFLQIKKKTGFVLATLIKLSCIKFLFLTENMFSLGWCKFEVWIFY